MCLPHSHRQRWYIKVNDNLFMACLYSLLVFNTIIYLSAILHSLFSVCIQVSLESFGQTLENLMGPYGAKDVSAVNPC
jgi:hypothetical protein